MMTISIPVIPALVTLAWILLMSWAEFTECNDMPELAIAQIIGAVFMYFAAYGVCAWVIGL